MLDRFGRKIEYLRISVTQDCNLKCVYCIQGMRTNSCSKLLPEDIEKIVGIMAGLGIRKVRITGGEPLMRHDICDIIRGISGIYGIEDISLTTNGIMLGEKVHKLKMAGLKRVNISLDSLKTDRFASMTGGGRLEAVLDGIGKSIEAGLNPVKVNTVLIKGINDDEIEDFILLAKEYPIEVRFIELMPIGKFGEQNIDKVVYNTEIIALHPDLIPCSREDGSNGPARCFMLEGYKGRIGFISPLSHKFCSCCNRIRLTCDGKIRTCLGDNNEFDITGLLGHDDNVLNDAVKDIIDKKPVGHCFEHGFNSNRNMNAIGG